MTTVQQALLASCAITIGTLPLVRVTQLRAVPRHVWLMAVAFAVSVASDVTDLLAGPGLASQVYAVSQAGLFALALRPDRIVPVLGVVVAAAGWSLATRHGEGLDVVLHVTAFLSVLWCAWTADKRDHDTRMVLAVGFGWLAVAWAVYASSPSLATWGAFQAVRLALTVGWCVAVAKAER